MTEESTNLPASEPTQPVEQQVSLLQSQLDLSRDELATAEAQRDEIRSQLTVAENLRTAERLLTDSEVCDMETACLLLRQRVDLTQPLSTDELPRQVEKLLLDKSFLRKRASPSAGPMPTTTSSPRTESAGRSALLIQAAERAIQTGDRSDVAEYLRLRRLGQRT